MKIVSPHFVRKRESVFIFLGTNRSHFAQQFAIRLMIEHLHCNRDQLFPVVPFADGVLDLAQLVDELLIAGVIRHLEDIAELLDSQSIGVQILSIQSCRSSYFVKELEHESHGVCCCVSNASAVLAVPRDGFLNVGQSAL